ncbi:hypothetical protein JHK87_005719 [Glycine soja]|nr:hypothetical protein JHK87_005719 [Glycine soja]
MKKALFKPKPKTPVELVRHARELIIFLDSNACTRESKREEKLSDLSKMILEIRTVLYGNGESEPNADACSQITREFFKDDTFRLFILYLSNLKLGARQDATHVIANLQRQRVNSQLIASQYLEKNLDLVDMLIGGYEKEGDIALTYGAVARECIRHQSVARHVLESEHMKKFFDYIQLPNFEIASDAVATFKELLTRHKSTVAEFLSKNYDWILSAKRFYCGCQFFKEYNSQLLESTSYFTRRYAIKLLGDMLLDRSNAAVMVQYVSSLDNMRILMNLLRLFVANQNKPPEVVSILVTNKHKLLQFLDNFNNDKADEHFQADKQQVISEIITLEHKDRPCTALDNCEVPC